MKNNRALVKVAAVALALVLVAAACGSDDDDSEPTNLPGEGISLTMARANWDTGYFQAALMRQLLLRLGYDVSDPSDLEIGPNLAYLSMAEGDIDFWANSWYPLHNSWLDNELPDGSKIGDHVSPIGELMVAGGLQGYLVTKSFAEEYNLMTIDDLNNNPEALAVYDTGDPTSGNGVADIYGCEESFTCDDTIASQIDFSGWENIDQVIASYDAMFAEASSRIDKGEPVVLYTWTPSSYITQVRPGDNVMWIGVEEVLDDSNPLGLEGGEKLDQRPGLASLDSDTCLYIVAEGCQIGFASTDILVTARNDLLQDHPAAKKLFEVVKLNVVDVSLQIVSQSDGASPDDLANQWIIDNSNLVEGWLAEAMAAT